MVAIGHRTTRRPMNDLDRPYCALRWPRPLNEDDAIGSIVGFSFVLSIISTLYSPGCLLGCLLVGYFEGLLGSIYLDIFELASSYLMFPSWLMIQD